MAEPDLLVKLSEWYAEQCNGDWEHGSGVSIDTVDNPGWHVTVNLRETALEHVSFEPIDIANGDSDWMFCFKRDNEFHGAGDPAKLHSIVEHFLKFAGKL
ncbi:Immunity protein 53 [Bryocella elongata]|uniref:Immunity protein 53 n=1 Tax=Bryocella elongata TaxID=863522 RepID=A0A1H6BXA6_9BACT|nr:immunity 53 family protein [Bryocella elongata]SEG65272.1 Immunity protein 53 [Bryocella elongata]